MADSEKNNVSLIISSGFFALVIMISLSFFVTKMFIEKTIFFEGEMIYALIILIPAMYFGTKLFNKIVK